MTLISDFFGAVMVTAAVLLVGAIPLWLVALWRHNSRVAARFAVAGGVLSVLVGLVAVGSELSVEACEADGGIGCADQYFGAAAFLLFAVFVYVVVALVAAIVVAFRGGDDTTASFEADHLWCEECTDLVAVAGHVPAHSLRPMALP